MNYTAKEAADKLQQEGFADITTRTVNYYAFEKSMFDISQTGKKCFTDKELKKMKAIKHLQKTTNFTLEQIKNIINKYDYEEIMTRVSPIVYDKVEDFYQSPGYTQSLVSAHLKNDSDSTAISAPLRFSHDNTALNPPRLNTLFVNSVPFVDENSKKRSIRINEDITLIVSHHIDTEKLTELVKCIRNSLQ